MLLTLVCLTLTCSQTFAAAVPVPLGTGYNDPTEGQGEPHRGPVVVPEVSIDGYELSFDTPCLGFTLQLVDENDNVVYSTIVNSSTLMLPSTLSGEYEILLIPNTGSSIYFYGFIMF